VDTDPVVLIVRGDDWWCCMVLQSIEPDPVGRYGLWNCAMLWNSKTYSTGLCNHNRKVFEEMSSWTFLTMHLGF